jgi:hypothetical protein
MTKSLNFHENQGHGAKCSCQLLAQAIGADPRTISYQYCSQVLQKHWHMTCTHGEPNSALATSGSVEHWRSVGPIDPVMAILMSNEVRDE